MHGIGLTGYSTADLQSVVRAIVLGKLQCPVTREGLHAAGLGELEDIAEVLSKFDAAATAVCVSMVVAEREAGGPKEPQLQPVDEGVSAHLLWTGPERGGGSLSDTAQVVVNMFATARESVVIAGFALYDGVEVLRPLHAAMLEHGVAVEVFLDLRAVAKPAGDARTRANKASAELMRAAWPFGPPSPTVYCDVRPLPEGVAFVPHAKCVVVDERAALVTSAGLSNEDTGSIDVGVIVEDPGFAQTLAAQWRALVDAGYVTRAG